MSKVRTARGDVLDFDLMKIKEQIAAAPQSLHVRKRKDFIEQRLRRRIKQKVVENMIEENKLEVIKTEVDVVPKILNTDVVDNNLVELEAPGPKEESVQKEPVKKVTRQRARKKTTEGEKNESSSESSS